MSIDDDIAFFSRVPTLSALSRPALRILAIGAENRYIHSGEILFNAGDPADAGFVVQEGSFRLAPPEGNTGRPMIAGPGSLIGELAMIAATKRPVTAIALEPSTVLRIPRPLFRKMLDGFPDEARRLRDLIASRTEQWTEDMHSLRDTLEP